MFGLRLTSLTVSVLCLMLFCSTSSSGFGDMSTWCWVMLELLFVVIYLLDAATSRLADELLCFLLMKKKKKKKK